MENNSIGKSTLKLINDLHRKGTQSYIAFIRHSTRRYDVKVENESLMGLTEDGKQAAYEFGEGILSENEIRFYSSRSPRCIETSDFIAKGFLSSGGKTKSNTILPILGSFYSKDLNKIVKIIYESVFKGEYSGFYRKWFAGNLPDDLIEDSLQSAQAILKESYNLLNESDRANHICITHDVNLYLLKEYFLKQKPEEYIVDYLEGAIVYKDKNTYTIINHEGEEKLPELFKML